MVFLILVVIGFGMIMTVSRREYDTTFGIIEFELLVLRGNVIIIKALKAKAMWRLYGVVRVVVEVDVLHGVWCGHGVGRASWAGCEPTGGEVLTDWLVRSAAGSPAVWQRRSQRLRVVLLLRFFKLVIHSNRKFHCIWMTVRSCFSWWGTGTWVGWPLMYTASAWLCVPCVFLNAACVFRLAR